MRVPSGKRGRLGVIDQKYVPAGSGGGRAILLRIKRREVQTDPAIADGKRRNLRAVKDRGHVISIYIPIRRNQPSSRDGQLFLPLGQIELQDKARPFRQELGVQRGNVGGCALDFLPFRQALETIHGDRAASEDQQRYASHASSHDCAPSKGPSGTATLCS